MGLQINCNCGWSSQVSEFYLGDRVSCPSCARKLNVHSQSGVPYGYAPYPTWQRRPARVVRMPSRRRAMSMPVDSHSGAAYWLAWAGLLLTVTGCGLVPGVLASVVSLQFVSQSRRFSREFNVPVPGRTRSATLLSVISLVVAAVFVFSMICESSRLERSRSEVVVHESLHPVDSVKNPRHEIPDASWNFDQAIQERNRASGDIYRYEPVVPGRSFRQVNDPRPTPVRPTTEFERYQSEYSRNVAQQRAR